MIATALPNQEGVASSLQSGNEKQGSVNNNSSSGSSIDDNSQQQQQKQPPILKPEQSASAAAPAAIDHNHNSASKATDDTSTSDHGATTAMKNVCMQQSERDGDASVEEDDDDKEEEESEPPQHSQPADLMIETSEETNSDDAGGTAADASALGVAKAAETSSDISKHEAAAVASPLNQQQQQHDNKYRIVYDAAQSVLAEIRRDTRYVHPARFAEELTVTEVYGHSLHMSFQQLLPQLHCSSSSSSSDSRTGEPSHQQQHSSYHPKISAASGSTTAFWIHPFCEALTQKDNSAPVVALVARMLTKFLECGLVVVDHDGDSTDGLQHIANAVVVCPWMMSIATNSTDDKTDGASHWRQSSHVHNIQHSTSLDSSGHVVDSTVASSTTTTLGLGGRRRSITMAARAAAAAAVAPHHQQESQQQQPALSSNNLAMDSHRLLQHPTAVGTEVVLNVLQLSMQTLRTAINASTKSPVLSGDLLMKLFERCWGAVQSTSSLIQSFAQTACQQMVATVFVHQSTTEATTTLRLLILEWLGDILQKVQDSSASSEQQQHKHGSKAAAAKEKGGSKHSHHHSFDSSSAHFTSASKKIEGPTAMALTLLSTTLDCCVSIRSDAERRLLETIAQHVLVLAIPTASEKTLQISLRVFFQLLDRLQMQHLKCEVELMIQNVHLRRLKERSSTPEEIEAVLESLLELCYGGIGSLQLGDLYLNYDCDVMCTNLFEAVMVELGKTACPDGWSIMADSTAANEKGASGETLDGLDSESQGAPSTSATTVATEDTTVTSTSANKTTGANSGSNESAAKATTSASTSANNKPLPIVSTHAPLNHLNRLALEGILSVLDSIALRCSGNYDPIAGERGGFDSVGCTELKEEELFARKQRKHAVAKVVQAFNSGNPEKGGFLNVAVAEGLFESTSDAAEVAKLLYHAPDGIDKRKLGVYLSRGPEKNFPFQAIVRQRFAEFYDFKGLTFAAALRRFLSKFHLPGEAQLIDRLMEAFSKEVYRQQADKGACIFKNSDAAYVLAFSTIMLNTDLHNPTIKADRRMTQEQFVKNNRGINGGDDLPDDFLMELYDQIKQRQLQVRRDAEDFMKKQKEDLSCAWDGILERKKEISAPVSLTSSKKGYVGLQDKEMFLILAKASLQAVSGVFVRSFDDALVVRTLRGLQQMVKVAAHFEHDNMINDVLQILLPQGRDYVLECIAYDQQQLSNGMDMEASMGTQDRRTTSTDSLFEEETTYAAENDQHIPFGLLCSSDERGQVEISGSATNRGLLALDSSFVLLRKYSTGVTDAWPAFFECLCAMRDCRSLPAGLADLDDFADSNGNVLPLSSFAKASKKRLEDHHRSLSDNNTNQQKGWFRSLFRKGQSGEPQESTEEIGDDESTSPKGMYSKTLLGVAKAADVESVVELGSSQLPDATVRDLLDKLDSFPFTNDPVGEQHAVFSLELAARTLLLNRERAVDLFLLFLAKFESILCKATISEDDVAAPFVVERIVVTILRSSIHLYELAEVRRMKEFTRIHISSQTDPRFFRLSVATPPACVSSVAHDDSTSGIYSCNRRPDGVRTCDYPSSELPLFR